MPRGPKGEKRPADVVGAAVKVMKIATDEIEEDTDDKLAKNAAAAELGRGGGAAIGILSTSGGTRNTVFTDGGPTPSLMRNLPNWLVRQIDQPPTTVSEA